MGMGKEELLQTSDAPLVREAKLAKGFLGVLGFAVISILCSCGGGGGGGPVNQGLIAPGLSPFVNSSRQAISAACTANSHVAGRARWTVLLFINAASNLQDDSWLNVAQMASVGSDSNVNIVVEWKQSSSNPYFNLAGIQPAAGDIPSFVGTRRYLISKHSAADVAAITNGDTTSLNIDRLPDPPTNVISSTDPLGTSDMGDWHVLRDFVQWGAAAYPADHLAVDVWDHGSAALSVSNNRSVSGVKIGSGKVTSVQKGGVRAGLKTRSVSFDCNSGSQITTPQLAQALSSLGTAGTQRNDILIIDCSLEGTAEVAFECRNVARVYVATEESPPGQGLAYDLWLTALKASGKNPCDLGNSIVSTFISQPAYVSDFFQSELTMSMTDLTALQNVISALDAFGIKLRAHRVDSAAIIASARDTSQTFDFSDYKDLYDFADHIRTSGAPAELKQSAMDLETAMVSSTTGSILASQHGNDRASTHGRATGLTIHFPLPGQLESEYATLAISQPGAAPNWGLFLQTQVQ